MSHPPAAFGFTFEFSYQGLHVDEDVVADLEHFLEGLGEDLAGDADGHAEGEAGVVGEVGGEDRVAGSDSGEGPVRVGRPEVGVEERGVGRWDRYGRVV